MRQGLWGLTVPNPEADQNIKDTRQDALPLRAKYFRKAPAFEWK
jgi:hypothetical protein